MWLTFNETQSTEHGVKFKVTVEMYSENGCLIGKHGIFKSKYIFFYHTQSE